jgi:putative nucleotidyltransferase with HDIG domain
MRFATRAFAFCFIPIAILLGVSFWALQSMVQTSAREQLRSAMRDKQVTLARMRKKNDVQISRFLRFAGENAALKAGLQLLNSEPESSDARRTVQDQIQELGSQIGFNILSVSSFTGGPVAWVVREGDHLEVPDTAPSRVIRGLSEFRGQIYQLVSVPIDQGNENLGSLTIGDRFDLAELGVPAVLFQNGRIVRTSQAEAPPDQLASAFTQCDSGPECDIHWNGIDFLSIEIKDAGLGTGYSLRSLQNVDAAVAPVLAGLRGVFLTACIGAVFAAFLFSAGSSRSLMRPLAEVVSHLKKSEADGLLMELPADYSRIVEIRDLILSFNRAAASIRDGRDGLHAAYVEFVGSLASALDARDQYSAGHSRRVSQVAASIAQALELSAEEQERVRIGALLHDIGKIGIPDSVLQKPGLLSDAEFTLIKQHPSIGCKILKGVHGFTPYLPAVELHHENWDGSGYPLGLHGEETPLVARIVHVADAWDAMTTDRPYRRGFSPARALAIITINAGTQFDPQIAKIFSRMMQSEVQEEYQSILRLAAGVSGPCGSHDFSIEIAESMRPERS